MSQKSFHSNLNVSNSAVIEKGAIIDVREGSIGDRCIIRAGARIEGRRVDLGKECYLDYGAWIGGGSCFDEEAFLHAGDWLHMGWNSHINTAKGVKLGNEIGIGVETKVFTHGAYLPIDWGFPVQWGGVIMGDKVWLPNAWVNPGVGIGSNVVVAARSLVNKDIPSGCFAGGIPIKISTERIYPKDFTLYIEQIVDLYTFQKKFGARAGIAVNGSGERELLVIRDKGENGETIFNLSTRQICGRACEASEAMKNQLRRNGIRFPYCIEDGYYVPW